MRSLNISETIQDLVAFIRGSTSRAGFSQVVVAVSGGVDSATATSLAVKAFGPKNVHALLLPYKDWHVEAVVHARLLTDRLQLPQDQVHEIDIAPGVDALKASLILKKTESAQMRLGNIMARVRMIALFDFAKKLPALVLGTENKSEHLLGYYTRFGDEASDLEPLRGLFKTEVYQLAKALQVPDEIIHKSPTAGLWKDQTDEGEFGFSYAEADQVLHGLFEEKKTQKQLVEQGMKKEVVDRVKKWTDRVSFKHHLPVVAPEPKVR